MLGIVRAQLFNGGSYNGGGGSGSAGSHLIVRDCLEIANNLLGRGTPNAITQKLFLAEDSHVTVLSALLSPALYFSAGSHATVVDEGRAGMAALSTAPNRDDILSLALEICEQLVLSHESVRPAAISQLGKVGCIRQLALLTLSCTDCPSVDTAVSSSGCLVGGGPVLMADVPLPIRLTAHELLIGLLTRHESNQLAFTQIIYENLCRAMLSNTDVAISPFVAAAG